MSQDIEIKSKFDGLMSGTELLRKQAEEPASLPTGWLELDEKLNGHGLPRGGLSLVVSPPGLGATSFWLNIARRSGEQKRWSLWISQQSTLFAPALWSQGLNLKHLYVIQKPTSTRDLQFALRECLESGLFTWVGCEVENLKSLRRSLPQLKLLAERSKTAFAFLSPDSRDLKRTHEFSWVAQLDSQNLIVHKSKNRPSFSLPWRGSYAHLLSQLSQAHSPRNRRGLPEPDPTAAFPRAGSAVRRSEQDLVALPQLERPA